VNTLSLPDALPILMGAPSEIPQKQLKEVHIKLDLEE
jgi:aspartyl-tRNA synthetase